MKVLHIAATLAGGAGIGLQRYHQALKAAALESRIIVPAHNLSDQASTSPDVSGFSWSAPPLITRIKRRLGLAGFDHEIQARSELSRLQSSNPDAQYELFTLPFSFHRPEEHPWLAESDLVALHWTADALDWPRFFKAVKQPVVMVLHDQNHYLGGFHYQWDADRNPAFSTLESKLTALKSCQLRGKRCLVVANSRWNAGKARDSKFFDHATRIESVYYPLDGTRLWPMDKIQARKQLSLPTHRLIIGFASGSLANDRKGLDVLLEALKLLPRSLSSQCVLLSFGQPPASSTQQDASIDWIHLNHLSKEEEQVTAYSAMDVFVAPSHAEAFGLTALEAQACGTAAIALPHGGLREAVADNPVAVGQPETVVSRLAAGIEFYLTNPKMRRIASAKGLKMAQQRHAPDRIGSQLRELFETHVCP